MSDHARAIFEVARKPKQFMTIFGVDHAMVNANSINAAGSIKLQRVGAELQTIGDTEDMDEVTAKRLDALLGQCVKVVLPTLSDDDLADLGFMSRAGILGAFTEASGLTTEPTPAEPLQKLRPTKKSSSTSSPTSSATTAASA